MTSPRRDPVRSQVPESPGRRWRELRIRYLPTLIVMVAFTGVVHLWRSYVLAIPSPRPEAAAPASLATVAEQDAVGHPRRAEPELVTEHRRLHDSLRQTDTLSPSAATNQVR